MAEDQDSSQKTEEPTSKKLADARKKGDAPKSQEINVLAVLTVATLCMAFLSNGVAKKLALTGQEYFSALSTLRMEPATAYHLFGKTLLDMFSAVGLVILALVIAALLANILQQMPVLSAEKMKPDLKKLSPLKGLTKMFGLQGLVNFAKGLVKLAIVGLLLVLIAWPERDALLLLLKSDVHQLLPYVKGVALKMMGGVLAALAVLAVADYAYQRFEFMKRMRMTKQEVRDEHKQTEGDPQVKAKIRAIRQDRARKRMINAVPEATVVVANPTHFAVALKYERGEQGAPLCVAKGVDHLALKIREVAEQNNVPVVENPPLARALYGSVEVDEEIPLEHYKAVAKVIGYVFGLARRKR